MTGGRRVRGANRRLRALGAFAVAVPLTLAGCTTPAAPGQPGGHTAPRETSAERVAAFADDWLASMTLTEKVASLLMLHRPGTDAAELRSFADSHGLGGLILMGDNVPTTAADLAALTAGVSSDPGLPLPRTSPPIRTPSSTTGYSERIPRRGNSGSPLPSPASTAGC